MIETGIKYTDAQIVWGVDIITRRRSEVWAKNKVLTWGWRGIGPGQETSIVYMSTYLAPRQRRQRQASGLHMYYDRGRACQSSPCFISLRYTFRIQQDLMQSMPDVQKGRERVYGAGDGLLLMYMMGNAKPSS